MARIIDDKNYRIFLAGNHNKQRSRPAGALPRRTGIGDLACAAVYAEHVDLIPENQWEQRVADIDAAKAWPQDIYDQRKPALQDQNGMNFCWAFSLAQCVEINEACTNQPYVQLGPESLGGDVGWRNAGNYLDGAIEYAAQHGIAERSYVPEHSRKPSSYKAGWEANALTHKPIEWWDLGATDMWAETVSVILSGFPLYVGLDWASHAVCYTKLGYQGGELCAYTPNTWGAGEDWWLKGRKKVPSLGCFAVRSTTFEVPQ